MGHKIETARAMAYTAALGIVAVVAVVQPLAPHTGAVVPEVDRVTHSTIKGEREPSVTRHNH